MKINPPYSLEKTSTNKSFDYSNKLYRPVLDKRLIFTSNGSEETLLSKTTLGLMDAIDLCDFVGGFSISGISKMTPSRE
jgi:hypothetical protein